jgi:S-adenosylmethionine synthetase
MYECVNPSHPDKVADRIAGAIVDLAYKKERAPKIAVEVLIGHGLATIIAESSVRVTKREVKDAVLRISGIRKVKYVCVPQDVHLASNQAGQFRCGDNGIFKAVPTSHEELELAAVAKHIYDCYPYDGKYIFDAKNGRFIICQSHAVKSELQKLYPDAEVNPIGDWTGGSDVDSGATNRKLGSDMARCVSGGGLHGKDLSKADVSINIYAFIKSQKTQKPVEICCAIGDEFIDGKPYGEIATIAREYIKKCGGFEKFAEWGLIGGPEPSQFFGLLN